MYKRTLSGKGPWHTVSLSDRAEHWPFLKKIIGREEIFKSNLFWKSPLWHRSAKREKESERQRSRKAICKWRREREKNRSITVTKVCPEEVVNFFYYFCLLSIEVKALDRRGSRGHFSVHLVFCLHVRKIVLWKSPIEVNINMFSRLPWLYLRLHFKGESVPLNPQNNRPSYLFFRGQCNGLSASIANDKCQRQIKGEKRGLAKRKMTPIFSSSEDKQERERKKEAKHIERSVGLSRKIAGEKVKKFLQENCFHYRKREGERWVFSKSVFSSGGRLKSGPRDLDRWWAL